MRNPFVLIPALVIAGIFATPVIFSSSVALAFKIMPMEADFILGSDGHSTQSFTVENSLKDKIAVEIALFARNADESGKELREATSDFNVYPEQFQLEPGEKRNVNVTWVGPSELPHEKAYRLIASQLPVQLGQSKQKSKEPKVDLRFVLQYVASLYVKKTNMQPHVHLVSIVPEPDKGAARKAKVTIINDGDSHLVTHGLTLKLYREPKGPRFDIASADLKGFDFDNLLAQSKRSFTVSVPATFKFDPSQTNLNGELKISAP
jgi:fimbrial chaperone protein